MTRTTVKQEKSQKGIVIIALIACALIALIPLFALKGAEFGGSDDAGSQKIGQILNLGEEEEYEPWFEPILETAIGGELPGEVESLFFCLQTAIGVGIIAYAFGYLVARHKYAPQEAASSGKKA